MHLSALLDFDVVPLDTDDAVSVLLDATAPEREKDADRPLAKSAQAVSLRVPSGPHVRGVEVIGEVPSSALPDGSLMVELGDLYSGESRRLLLRVEVPGVSTLGAVTVTTVEATYVDPATLTTYTTTLPVTVNVVPGDEAAGRAPRPDVRTEEALQRAQTAKRRASEALRRGDREAAAEILDEARRNLPEPPAGSARHPDPQVDEQADELGRMARRARRDDASRTSKELYASQSGYSRRREHGLRKKQREEEIRGQETGRDQSFPDQEPPNAS
ncbi:hypothetical protein AB0I72_17970 [Nocardiopsis sp. NPDC049922]|uniref:hypothetical protein n=1 Tax=Nocardiopsis sp. NPDC049922 TaxID=3155157 RepID=UPI003402C7E3